MSEMTPSSAIENTGQIKEPGLFAKLMDIKVGVIALPVYLAGRDRERFITNIKS